MTHDAQLAWERRAARPAAAAAFVSTLLGLASLAIGASMRTDRPLEDRVDQLIFNHEHPDAYMTSAWLQAISLALLGVVLYYLFRATRYRRPELTSRLRYPALGLPPILGVLTVLSAIEHLNAAERVVAKLPLPPKAAVDLAEDELFRGPPATVGLVFVMFALAFAFTIGPISLNARRVGLLGAFMGIIGVIVGVLLVLSSLLVMPPFVQYFWTTALGLIFLDRLPARRERGPAWETGEPIPWPTAAEIRAQALGEAPPAPRDESEYDDEDEPAPAGTQHPRSKKRKRKRRR